MRICLVKIHKGSRTPILSLSRPSFTLDTKELEEPGTAATQCAHIVPESTYFRFSDDKKKDCAAPVLAVLKCFGYNIDNLNRPKIHSLRNVMTLIASIHDFFDQLQLWFEATER
ncbi:hypothetical protein C8J55DRAFT_491064 [Lentinula edodes]|uniref:HNH nuclease domain-containing protein n=1 Tax=Lentinula lateritia TaxID=40482 RepID=A0A9W9DK81_9AGAR|nr:hypothetical protein C8J55DRAFT_491064 [Lentinula edodes]